MPDLELVTDSLKFPEGPVATSDGVVLVEIQAGSLTRVRVDGSTHEVARCGGGPNGAAVGPDGKFYVCNNGGFEWHEPMPGLTLPGHQPHDYIGGRIQRVDPVTGTVDDVYTAAGPHDLKGPNDIVFDAHGGLWFTDLGKSRARDLDQGGLYYALPDGTRIDEVVHPLTTPNGVGLSPGGDRLYVAETQTGRVWAWDVAGPGQLSPSGLGPGGATLLYGFPGYQLLDSLAVDSAGNVCVATLVTGAISVISPEGELLEQVGVPEPDPLVTNICFGGDDLRTAYITSSGRGRLYATTWPVPGLALAHTI